MGFARQAPSEVVAITAATARVEHDDPARPFIGNPLKTSVPSQNSIDLQLILVALKDCIVEEE
jgi:hypothetical protein